MSCASGALRGKMRTPQGGARVTAETAVQVHEELDHVQQTGRRLEHAMAEVMSGKPEVLRLTVTVLFAGGHLLIEDVPGVGKTVLAKSLARAIDCDFSRVQFTPDLLPSEITGVAVFNQGSHVFEFRPGAIFANIVLGDEINRASPKTQSALLESMEEGQVTADGQTHILPQPFLVMATQNPVEMEGTYPLPEAQRDRFMARISVGYPSPTAELAMLTKHSGRSPLESLHPVTDGPAVLRAIAACQHVHTSPALLQYVVDLVTATRRSSSLRLGASPRASLQLVRAARASAALAGRDYVLPDDVQRLAVPVLAHRVIPSSEAVMSRLGTDDIVARLVPGVPVPSNPPRLR